MVGGPCVPVVRMLHRAVWPSVSRQRIVSVRCASHADVSLRSAMVASPVGTRRRLSPPTASRPRWASSCLPRAPTPRSRVPSARSRTWRVPRAARAVQPAHSRLCRGCLPASPRALDFTCLPTTPVRKRNARQAALPTRPGCGNATRVRTAARVPAALQCVHYATRVRSPTPARPRRSRSAARACRGFSPLRAPRPVLPALRAGTHRFPAPPSVARPRPARTLGRTGRRASNAALSATLRR